MRFNSMILACTIGLFSPVIFAKSVELKKVNIKVTIKNEVPGILFNLTGADTYLSCMTKYSEGFGEAGALDNSVTPETQIGAKPFSIASGGQSEISITVLKEESVTAPSKIFNKGKECEFSLGLSLDIFSSDLQTSYGKINPIYGSGINVNHGFSLIGTQGTSIQNLLINKDFNIDAKLKTEYGGTEYSVKEQKQVPVCKLGLYQTVGNTEVQIGYISKTLNSSFCKIP